MPRYSVKKPLTIFVAALAVVILGVVAFLRMTPDLLPNMDFPYVVILTTYPGASPETVEEEVTKPLEQAMATLEHIKSVSSTSSENVSVLMLEFEDSVNMDTIGVDIQQNILSLSGVWDDAVGTPFVLKINPSLLPVAVAAVSMEGMDAVELSDFVNDTLLPRLEGVTGVARITSIGSVDRQVHVVIDQNKIDAVNARLEDSINAQLDDTAADLEKTRAELEEARAALDEAEGQLESGRSQLVSQTASAEAAISQQTVAALEGRMELQQQLVSLNSTIAQLETTLGILRPIRDRLVELEGREAELSGRTDALESGLQALSAADANLADYAAEIAALEAARDAAALLPDAGGEGDSGEEGGETESGEDGESESGESSEIDYDARIAEILSSEGYLAALDAVTAAENALEELGSDRYNAPVELLAAQAEYDLLRAELAAIDATLSSFELDRTSAYAAVDEMEAGLLQAQDGAALLKDALDQLDAGTMQLSEAMGTLSAAKSEGLLGIADAAAKLASNSAAVDQAMAQVDSGLDTLEDSRETALASADITDTISMSTVSAILGAQDFAMPAGYVEQAGVNYMVSVGDKLTDPDELRALVLFDTGEDRIGTVTLDDVAEVFVTDNSAETYARLDGEHGLILTFEKQSNAATADVTDALRSRFRSLESAFPGLHFVSLMDQGDYIRLIVSSILESLLTGALFAILVLLLFLRDLRPTVITLVAIPLSLVFAVVLMYFSGVTINMISLSGLAVAVGMLVDNAIVVIENIYRLRAKGATAAQAAVAGTKQVAGAITSSTLTTVCVFLPIVFVQGITRQLFTDLALTMGYSLMASLVVALTLVPAMAQGMLRHPLRRGRKQDDAPAREGRFLRAYRAAIGWSLDHKAAVLLLALFLLAGSAYLALRRGFSFMPTLDANTVNVTITMPEDATMEEAVDTADEVLRRIAEVENVETVGAMMGGSSLLLSTGGGSYDVTAYVTLPEGASGAAAGREIAARCADLPCTVSADSQMMDMSYLTGSGIAANVYGSDMEDLQAAARMLADAFAELPGVESADDGLADAAPALHVRVDKNAAMARGYTVAQLYAEIAARLTTSTVALAMDMDGITADVLVETGSTLTSWELQSMKFTYTDEAGETASFRLRDVATLERTVSLASIQRSGQRRYIGVTAKVEPGYNVSLVTADAEKAAAALDLPSGVTVSFTGENETTMKAVRDLGLMLLLGILLVYFIMVAQFQSLKSPFIVMFTIPLAFTGGFLALLITGLDVSVISLIGFVMLTGIIVNNGIVLVDYVNQLRAGGLARRDALIEAGVTRLRPILMTSLTTILGLAVMALGRDVGTALMQPVALVCIGGLLYATLMTLFVVPCIYDRVNRKELRVVTEEDLDYREL